MRNDLSISRVGNFWERKLERQLLEIKTLTTSLIQKMASKEKEGGGRKNCAIMTGRKNGKWLSLVMTI